MDFDTLKKSLSSYGNVCSLGQYVMRETGSDATLKEVTIRDIPENSLVIKMDKIKFTNLFNSNVIKSWGFNKHSDYLIVTQDRLVFVEMKSRTSVNSELEEKCRKKFLSDSCTINYADDIFIKLLSKNSFFNNKKTHYVLLYQSVSVNKKNFLNLSQPSNNTPETFRKIAVCNEAIISYNRVI